MTATRTAVCRCGQRREYRKTRATRMAKLDHCPDCGRRDWHRLAPARESHHGATEAMEPVAVAAETQRPKSRRARPRPFRIQPVMLFTPVAAAIADQFARLMLGRRRVP